ncbi:exodeoxyribonuclease III [Ferrimonas balearica]|uniref:exodeoxyribonuclease III n=1 Tax=Ferrimonas balearica TaxID=44012 RepID=UPI001C998C6C|nr:exodeoxyribonuclease III [Ferrimonas balearica]MBY5922193.1 exodeoxyribonuclease III [Ferrimonas balearica]MBY5994467.1 exodeoxyribonuclease III [Ferrimonas balearica]
MKFVSFNINGLRARLHQLEALIEKHQPDVIGLQETKVDDPQFPLEAVEAMGYHVAYHGQKAHYGVAMLTKQKPLAVQKGFATDDDEAQRRMIMVTVEDGDGQPVHVLNGYFPQGENRDHETKFPAKRRFYADLMTHLSSDRQADEQVVVMGDINISPTDLDIGIGEVNAKRWLKTGKCSFLPEEREWLATLLNWGLTDSFRHLNPEESQTYSWFDYRSRGFDDNRGLRIDVILTSAPLTGRLVESGVDYELRGIEKPSDHAPIWTTIR